MSIMDVRTKAEHEAALRTINARIVGARYEIQQALEESGKRHMTSLVVKLDHALMQLDSALESDALKAK